MDNRIDVTEDFQSTPEHPGSRTPAPATQQPADSQLTAGPHNDPPPSKGIAATYQPPPDAGGGLASKTRRSAWWWLQRTVNRHPLQVALGVAGLGLTLDLLARRTGR